MIKKSLVAAAVASTILLAGCQSANVKPTQEVHQNTAAQEAAKYHTTVGMIHIQRNELAKAKRPLVRALENDPNHADAHSAFALLYIKEGEHELANDHYQAAVKSEPKNSRILNNYGSYLYGQGNFKDAAKYLKRATEDTLYDKRPIAFVNLAKCELKLEQMESAIKHFEKAIQLDPRTFDAYLSLSKLSYDSGDLVKADDLIDKYRAARGQHSPQSLLLGTKVSTELGNRGKAKSYEIVLKNLYPTSVEYQSLFDYQVKQKMKSKS